MTSPWVDGEAITASKMYNRITLPLNNAVSSLTGTAWVAVPFGASYNGDSSPNEPLVRIRQGAVEYSGSIVRTAGTFPTNSTVPIIGAGGLGVAYRPAKPRNFIVSMRSIDTGARCIVNPDGSMTLVTGPATSDRFDLAPVWYPQT